MKTPALIIVVLLAISSCDFSKSVNKDLITGLTTKGDGLSCENVYLSDGENKINSSEFIYGEKFYLSFDNIKGFKEENSFAFPGMQMIVLNMENDTIMIEDDLFKNQTNGTDLKPLLLEANLTVAKPMHSNEEYKFFVNIWDKKGDGTFKAKMKFNVVPNDKLKIENNNLSYSELYLYSEISNKVITDNKVNLNEKVFLVFEKLEGFNLENGKVFIGMTISAVDNKGNELIKAEDLYEDIGYDYSEIKNILAAHVIFTGQSTNNPINCEFIVWDKKGDNKIKITTELNLN